MNILPPLKKWVLSNKYFIKVSDTKENKSKATHFLLDGGLWNIPKEEYSTFLNLLSVDLQNGNNYYISENRTSIFRFVCDLDFYDDSEITTLQIERVVNTLQEVIHEYYLETHVVICGTETKTVTKESVDYVKTGFHLVWPKIYISVERAKELRLKFIEKLINTYGQRDLINTWEDVVDLAIYEDNGLRMIGCRKMAPCKLCKGKNKECEKCFGKNKVDEGRVYKPVSVIGKFVNEDYFKSIQNDYYVMLLETCIYNYHSFPETGIIKNLPITTSTQNPKKRTSKKKSNTESDLTEIETKVENYINKVYKEHYSKLGVKKVTRADNDKYYVEVNDNYCMNVERNHTSSNIYFQIKRTGICQRCFCKKASCREYASPELKLSKILENYLFGPLKTPKGAKRDIINFNVKYNKDNYLDICKSILSQLEDKISKQY